MIGKAIAAAIGLAALVAGPAAYAIDVDGNLDAGYGPSKSSVVYVPAAPGAEVNGNFDAPTPFTSFLGYNVYLTDTGGVLYGFLQGTDGNSAGAFANLYFGDPGTFGVGTPPSRGSVIGFELSAGTQRAFNPDIGAASYVNTPGVTFAALGNNIEFAIPDYYFTAPVSGSVNAGFSSGDTVALRLSQSFGYSVAGGELYGPNRLGTVTLGANAVAVPGPVAGAGLVPLFGLAGAWFARRRKRLAA